MSEVEILAEKALEWMKHNAVGINETIEMTIAKDERNATVQTILQIGKDRSRTVHSGIPYGVGRLKSNLINDLGMTAPQANATVTQLKRDERIFQIGRGLGKMVAVFNGNPKAVEGNADLNALWDAIKDNINTPAEQVNVPIFPAVAVAADIPEALKDFDQFTLQATISPDPAPVLSPRVSNWIVANRPPRKAIRNKVIPQLIGAVALEKPPIADYGDLQEIYDEIETAFKEKFAKLRAKCDELMEENMVLNQATWQS
jgi:hypothetical protein